MVDDRMKHAIEHVVRLRLGLEEPRILDGDGGLRRQAAEHENVAFPKALLRNARAFRLAVVQLVNHLRGNDGAHAASTWRGASRAGGCLATRRMRQVAHLRNADDLIRARGTDRHGENMVSTKVELLVALGVETRVRVGIVDVDLLPLRWRET